MLKKIFWATINILFPEQCVGCKTPGVSFCTTCLNKARRAREHEHKSINAIFDYQEDSVRKAIWRLKYKNARSIAYCVGGIFYEELLGDLSDTLESTRERILLVPIPLHKKRQYKRGYNQSELLARAIKKHDENDVFELCVNKLIRIHDTSTQVKKRSKQERLRNLHDAFSAHKDVTGRHIILIDDVTTTGATLSEASRALKKAGARKISMWALAH